MGRINEWVHKTFLKDYIQVVSFWLMCILAVGAVVLSILSATGILPWALVRNVNIAILLVLITDIGLMVYTILEQVDRKLLPQDRDYKKEKSIKSFFLKIDGNLKVEVFLGLDNSKKIFTELISFLNSVQCNNRKCICKENFSIYVNYDMIENIPNGNHTFFLTYNLPKNNLIITKSESNSIQDIYYIKNNTPFFEYVKLKRLDNILISIIDNFFNHIQTIKISDSFSANSMRYLFSSKCLVLDKLINDKFIQLESKEVFFTHMTDILNFYTGNLYAIDFIPPHCWLEDINTKNYGLAHKNIQGTKQRIHVIDIETIKNASPTNKKKMKQNYEKYITFMTTECLVELYFLELSDFDTTKHEKRGRLILDNKCVFIALNPEEGAPLGEVNFNIDTINQYKAKFDNYFPKIKTTENIINKLNSLTN